MSAQTTKATLAGRFGQQAREAAAKSAKNPVRKPGQRDLPAPIRNGVARLIQVFLEQLPDNTDKLQLDGSSAKGQLRLVMVGAVEHPKVFQDNGVMLNLEGRQFRQYIPIYEKGASFRGAGLTDLSACIDAAQNELKLVGGKGFDASDVDKAIAILANAKPKAPFMFETNLVTSTKINPKTKKPFEPTVFVNWLGCDGLENYSPNAEPAVEEAPPDTAPTDEVPFDETTGDLGADADLVDGNPEAAGTEGTPEYEAAIRLGEAATAAGMSDDDIGQYGSWREILDYMQSLNVPEPEPEPEPPKPARPAPKPAPKKPAPKAAAKPSPRKK